MWSLFLLQLSNSLDSLDSLDCNSLDFYIVLI